jgi:hypothetical protein
MAYYENKANGMQKYKLKGIGFANLQSSLYSAHYALFFSRSNLQS